jgi:hypothetical protein
MTERIRIEYEGEPGGMRRAFSNALRLAERDAPTVEVITVTITFGPPRPRGAPQGDRPMSVATLRDNQEIPFTLRLLSGAGNPGKFESEPDLIVTPEEIGTIEFDPETGEGKFVASGALGTASVEIVGDAAFGPDVRLVRVAGTIIVETGEVTTGEIVFGEARPIESAPETPAA